MEIDVQTIHQIIGKLSHFLPVCDMLEVESLVVESVFVHDVYLLLLLGTKLRIFFENPNKLLKKIVKNSLYEIVNVGK